MGLLRTLLLASVLVAAGCENQAAPADQAPAGGRGAGRGGGSGAGAAVPVLTAHVSEKSLPVTVPTIGTAEASSTVEVRPQVSGQLIAVGLSEGDEVKEGQLLFTIDPRPFEVALKQAQAALAKDSAQAENAQAILKRSDDLLKQRIISQADRDTQAASARALAETANADQAQVDAAKLNLQYTKIVAPISGRTGSLVVHPGSLVRTTDTAPLLVINELTPIRVAFAMPAQYLDQVRAGQAQAPLRAEARAAGSSAAASVGNIFFIDNVIDPSTGTIKLKALFPNTDRRLWPGELVEVLLRLAVEPHAMVVPAAAIQNGQQGQFVFVVNADRSVVMRPVSVARTAGDDAVIASGLKIGEEIVTDGQLRLTPGVKVSVKPPIGGRGTP
jgi:multidrug efflux system membrane fusion protein